MFTENGYLAPGLHKMSLDEIEAAFVSDFPFSSTRSDIIEGFKRHLDELKAIIPDFEQLLNGSFVTNKNDPGDVDLVCFIDAEKVDALPPESREEFEALLSGPKTKETHLCDAYFVPVYPENHPHNNNNRTMRKYWLGEFGFDRQEQPKGVVIHEVADGDPDELNQGPQND